MCCSSATTRTTRWRPSSCACCGAPGYRGWRRCRQVALSAPAAWLRPLLQQPRAALEAYATAQGLSWVEDPSNGDTALDRNFLRSEVLPLLAGRWPGYRRTVARAAQHIASAAALLAQAVPVPATVYSAMGDPGIHLADIDPGSPEAALALRHWLQAAGLPMPDQAALAEFQRQLAAASERSQAAPAVQRLLPAALPRRGIPFARSRARAAGGERVPAAGPGRGAGATRRRRAALAGAGAGGGAQAGAGGETGGRLAPGRGALSAQGALRRCEPEEAVAGARRPALVAGAGAAAVPGGRTAGGGGPVAVRFQPLGRGARPRRIPLATALGARHHHGFRLSWLRLSGSLISHLFAGLAPVEIAPSRSCVRVFLSGSTA